uniref:Uncharacterized protein n=1 Tax=Caenorhabditis japonica TaxID=281687 RepID=A0A8R1J1W3_CAEJA
MHLEGRFYYSFYGRSTSIIDFNKIAEISASLVLGYFSLAVSLLNIVHATGIYLHFQIVMQFIKDKNFMLGESQAVYIGIGIVLQMVFTLVFGYNPEVKQN